MEEGAYRLSPELEVVSVEVGKLIVDRLEQKPIEERLDALSMCQVYSFWREMQDALQEASAEIKRLRKELNKENP